MDEYGLFNDEGCVERQFYSLGEAYAALHEYYSTEDDLTVRLLCPGHEEQPADGCEECEGDDDE